MIKYLFAILLSASCFANIHLAKVNDLEIAYETFGLKNNPPFLLIMGTVGQGIFWPTEFCEELARRGFYVIRYDHRGAGHSTEVDYARNPFDLSDLAQDAVELLDTLEIPKAHIFGLSMGGAVAEIVVAHHPQRVSSLALMGAYFDYRPLALKAAGLSQEPGLVSAPSDAYYSRLAEIGKMPTQTVEEQVEQKMQQWNLFNGTAIPLDVKTTKSMLRESIERTIHPFFIGNYRQAMQRSESLIQSVHPMISVPTVIFQGTEDPLIRRDHGEALAKAIPFSTYYEIQGMGHMPNPHFFNLLIDKLEENISRTTGSH